MMTTIIVTATEKGILELDIPDNATLDEIQNMVTDAENKGMVIWNTRHISNINISNIKMHDEN